MINQHRDATVKDSKELINNLRTEDLREVYARGASPLLIPFSIMVSDIATSFFNKEGDLAGVAGIIEGPDKGIAEVWMLTTPVIQQEPILFVKQAKKWLQDQPYTLLYNVVDARNELHLKLLKMLGFHALQEVTINNVPFYEVVKLCA